MTHLLNNNNNINDDDRHYRKTKRSLGAHICCVYSSQTQGKLVPCFHLLSPSDSHPPIDEALVMRWTLTRGSRTCQLALISYTSRKHSHGMDSYVLRTTPLLPPFRLLTSFIIWRIYVISNPKHPLISPTTIWRWLIALPNTHTIP